MGKNPKIISIQYLSQGEVETGGFRHEQSVANYLADSIQQQGYQVHNTAKRIHQSYKTLFGYMRLLGWFFKHATADITIVPLRGAIPSYFRNLFSNRKTVVVIHSRVQPYSSVWLKGLFRVLLLLFKMFNPKRMTIVTVSAFWRQKLIQSGVPPVSVILFPNLFNQTIYEPFRTTPKRMLIHLGMAEPKTHPDIYKLAKVLKASGFECYFSTLDPNKQNKYPDYSIVYFQSFESYLQQMAESLYTVQFPGVDEGWPRLAHESILVGTPLIGVGRGGLTALLEESRSFIVSSVDEFVNIITDGKTTATPPEFIHRYSSENAVFWIQPLTDFCLQR